MTIAVDFDGVIHAYSRGWQNGECYDRPVPGAVEALKMLMEDYPVVIFTARDNLPPVTEWLNRNDIPAVTDDGSGGCFWDKLGQVLVTNRKLSASVYIDDRAIRFETWDQALDALGEVMPEMTTEKSEETPRVSTEHHPLGTQGLWHTPDRHTPDKQQLPAYILAGPEYRPCPHAGSRVF